MKIAIMGSGGGVGGYVGALLAHAGHDVVFVARGAHLRAMQQHGLRVERADATLLALERVVATDNPATFGPVDLVVLGVKSYDLPPALEQIRTLVGPDTALLTTQNGVEAPDLAAVAYQGAAVLPGLVYSEVTVKEPGVIYQGASVCRIVFGERDGSTTARVEAIADALNTAGSEVTLSVNVLGALWTKFCFICAMGGLTALTRLSLGPILADPEGRVLIRTVMSEVAAVGQAHGISFDADPVEGGLATVERFNPTTKSSMLRDLERGNRLEVEALNGAAVRLGRAVGVATPANQVVYAALRLHPVKIVNR